MSRPRPSSCINMAFFLSYLRGTIYAFLFFFSSYLGFFFLSPKDTTISYLQNIALQGPPLPPTNLRFWITEKNYIYLVSYLGLYAVRPLLLFVPWFVPGSHALHLEILSPVNRTEEEVPVTECCTEDAIRHDLTHIEFAWVPCLRFFVRCKG